MKKNNRFWLIASAALALFWVLASGCGDDDSGDDTEDTDTADTDSGSETASDTGTELADNSCAEALSFSVSDAAGIQGAINPAGDLDFYKLEVTAGQYIFVRTDSNADDETEIEMVDPVISVYSTDGSTLLATADDAVPRVNVDSELWYRTPETTTLCIKVEEFSTWVGDTPKGDPSFSYALIARTFDALNGMVAENEPNDDLIGAQVEGLFNDEFALVYGLLDTVSDVDYYRFTQPTERVSARLVYMPSGPGQSGVDAAEGHGSTLTLDVGRLADTAGGGGGGNVLAEIDLSLGAQDIHLPLAPGAEAVFWIERPLGSTLGANDFYVVKHTAWETGNPLEAEANDTALAANALELATDTPGIHYFILGNIDPPVSDVDYFSFLATAGNTVSIACGAVRNGSGLSGATFGILDGSETELQSETETATADVTWGDSPFSSLPAVTISTTGIHYLVVSAAAQKPNVSSNFYRCGVHIIIL